MRATAQLDTSRQRERIQKVLPNCIRPSFFGVCQLTQLRVQQCQPQHISLMLSQSGTSGCSCLGFGRIPRRGTVHLPDWGMKTRKKGGFGNAYLSAIFPWCTPIQLHSRLGQCPFQNFPFFSNTIPLLLFISFGRPFPLQILEPCLVGSLTSSVFQVLPVHF